MPTESTPPEKPAQTLITNVGAGNIKQGEEISLLDLLIVLSQQKRLIVFAGGLVGVAALILSLLWPKTYTATTTILPPQQDSSGAAGLAAQLSSMGGIVSLAGSSLGLKNQNDMLVGMMKSRTVEDAMIQKFGLIKEYRSRYASDARKAFERKSKIDGNSKDGLIHISIEDRDPSRAAELANGYIEQFRELSEHLAITEASQRRLFFEQQLETAKDKLAGAEEALKITEQKTGLIQLDSQTRALIESAASLRAQIAAKEVEIGGLGTFATNQNAQLVQAQQQLDSMRAQLAKLGGSETDSDVNLIVPRGKVPEAGLEYVRKLRDVKYYETIFDILARQYELAKLDEAKQGALIQVVDPAVPPDQRTSPNRTLIVACGVLLGLLSGMVLALTRAAYRQWDGDPETARKLRVIRALWTFRRTSTVQSS